MANIPSACLLLFFFSTAGPRVIANPVLPEGVKLWVDDWKLCAGIRGRTPLEPFFSEQQNQVPQFKLSRRRHLCFWTNVAGNLAAAEALKTGPVTIVHQWLRNVGGAWGIYRELSAGSILRAEAMAWEANDRGYFDWRAETTLMPPEVGYYRVAVGVRFGQSSQVEELTRFDIEVID